MRNESSSRSRIFTIAARVCLALALSALASCSKGTANGPGSLRQLSGHISLAASDIGQPGTIVSLTRLSLDGTIAPLCDAPVDSGAAFFCNVEDDLQADAHYVLATAKLGDVEITSLFEVIAPDEDADDAEPNELVVSALGHLLAQRTLYLSQVKGVQISSALGASAAQLSAALGGTDLGRAGLTDAFDAALGQIATANGAVGNTALLADLLAQDFRGDGKFDGAGLAGALAFGGQAMSSTFWTGTVAGSLNRVLSANAVFVAAPPLAAPVAFSLLSPIVIADRRDVIVTWTDALADSYNLAVGSQPGCGDAGAATFGGITGTAQKVSSLTPGGVYYVCLTAIGGGKSVAVTSDTDVDPSFRVAEDAQ